MAAQIARPSDIVRPHAEEGADADRREAVLDKYKAGKVTAADEPAVKSTISHIGE
jgi:type IV pilus biogenesis protein CpaD/CtpE